MIYVYQIIFFLQKEVVKNKRNVIDLIETSNDHIRSILDFDSFSPIDEESGRVPRTRGSSNRLTFRRFWFYPRPLPTPPPEPPPPSPSSAHNACPFVPFAPSPRTPTPRARFARSSAPSGPPGSPPSIKRD